MFCVKTTTCCVHNNLIYYIFKQINGTLYEHTHNIKRKKLSAAKDLKILDKLECLKLRLFT